jgi:hypothetical protein
MEFDGFVAGGVAAQEFDLVAGAIEGFSEEAEQGIVGGSVNGRGGDFDAKLGAEGCGDFVG